MKRAQGWPEALYSLVESRRHEPFVWGVNDCALFAADAVLAQVGTDIAADVRGTYQDAASAAALIAAAGGLAILAAGRLPREIQPSIAIRGDILLVEHTAGQSLAVCVGNKAAAPGADGLMFLPRQAWLRAWRVG